MEEAALEVNSEETKYPHMFLCCHQNAGQYHNIQKDNKSLKIVTKFKYLGTAATNQLHS
jgi:hypothetical protein